MFFMKEKLKKLFLFLVIVLFTVNFVFAQHKTQGDLKTVRVAYFDGEGFMEKSSVDGRRYGYGYEYLQNLAYYAGWKYEYIDTNWSEAVEMIKKGEADILVEVTKTPEREKNMLFAERPMGNEKYYIYVPRNSFNIRAGSLETMNNKRIGVTAGTYQQALFNRWLKENNIHCNTIEYKDENERNLDFENGKLDAIVDYDFYLNQGWNPLINIGKSDYYVAVTKNRKDILADLNFAQEKLFESFPLFIERLQSIYYPQHVISEHLNFRELEWVNYYIKNYGRIKIGYIDDYLPYCSYNESKDKVEGALSIFIEKLRSSFDIEVDAVCYSNKEELYEDVRNGKLCAGFPLYNELWQTEKLGIMQSEKFINFPQTYVCRRGEYLNSLKQKVFAVALTNPMLTSFILDKYPAADIRFYENYEKCFSAINDGEVDGIFVNSYILARISKIYYQYENLDMSPVNNNSAIGFGVSYNCPELLSIFNKTISLVDDSSLMNSLVRNSQGETSYSVKEFIKENLHIIITIVLMLAIGIIFLLRTQLLRVKTAMTEADKERQKAQDANVELEIALEREKESQVAVKQAFDSANKANAAKTDFLASMSHDIRIPMNAIIGMTALAQANMDNKEKVSNCLTEINISSKHLLGLINEVLDMNKIESGKVSLTEQEFNLANLVDDFVSLSKALAKDKNHEFIVNVHDIKHENVIGDPERIQQCLMNFMSNAVKYTPENGKIVFSIKESPINRSKVACYEFIFEDNGIGMSKEFIPTLFEPFTRAVDDRVQKQQGTGLGMSITRNIIRMMNGDIRVESELNKGTKIIATIFLQLQETDESLNLEPLKDLEVLVVDDDFIACESICGILNEIGMKAQYVLSGHKAIELVKQRHEQNKQFFALIIDWKMPELDGIETVKLIREIVSEKEPIIISSAYDWSDIESEAKEVNVNMFISKPIFKSKIVHSFLELIGTEKAEEYVAPLTKYKKENFSGTRILLVEDNMVNTEIAKEILEMAGIVVDVASNGKEAVDILNNCEDGKYNLVFMDIQMPIMNGYEATVEIRKSPREYLKNVPIVAMSANAFAEDVQKSRMSGMNEHIAKPLDLDRLLTVLNKWIPR